jgi:hypothetical protein
MSRYAARAPYVKQNGAAAGLRPLQFTSGELAVAWNGCLPHASDMRPHLPRRTDDSFHSARNAPAFAAAAHSTDTQQRPEDAIGFSRRAPFLSYWSNVIKLFVVFRRISLSMFSPNLRHSFLASFYLEHQDVSRPAQSAFRATRVLLASRLLRRGHLMPSLSRVLETGYSEKHGPI